MILGNTPVPSPPAREPVHTLPLLRSPASKMTVGLPLPRHSRYICRPLGRVTRPAKSPLAATPEIAAGSAAGAKEPVASAIAAMVEARVRAASLDRIQELQQVLRVEFRLLERREVRPGLGLAPVPQVRQHPLRPLARRI